MPTLAPGELLARGAPPLPTPFARPEVSLWYSARVALWQAIRAFGLPAGGRAAVPAFCCGSELEPFLAAGLEIVPFQLAEDLSPDPASFAKAIDGASAALVTHYFGFPADLGPSLSLCRERGVLLIEDCAHALYARDGSQSVGLRGDAGVFSFWKTIALPDGGALYMRRQPMSVRAHLPPRAVVEKATRQLISRHARSHPSRWIRFGEQLRVRMGGRSRNGSAAATDRRDLDWELVRFHPEFADTTISNRSLQLLRKVNHDAVRAARRRNYQRLEAALRNVPGIKPFFPSLTEGACPLYFPVIASDAAGLRREFAGAAVGVKHVWPVFHPAVDWHRFPRERRWKELALGFPVHQSLREGDIDRIAAAVIRWART